MSAGEESASDTSGPEEISEQAGEGAGEASDDIIFLGESEGPAPPAGPVPAGQGQRGDEAGEGGASAPLAGPPAEAAGAVEAVAETATETAAETAPESRPAPAEGDTDRPLASPDSDAPAQPEPEDPYTCPICLAGVKDPMVGRCGHMYCYPCIRAWWSEAQGVRVQARASPGAAPRILYACPVCREPLDPEADLISLYAGVSSPGDSRPRNRGSELASEVRRAQRRREREQEARRARRQGVQVRFGGFPGMMGITLNVGGGGFEMGPMGLGGFGGLGFGGFGGFGGLGGAAREARGGERPDRQNRYSPEEMRRMEREDAENPDLTPEQRAQRRQERERARARERLRQGALVAFYFFCLVALLLFKAFLEQPRVFYIGPRQGYPGVSRDE